MSTLQEWYVDYRRGKIDFDTFLQWSMPFLIRAIRSSGCMVNQDTIQVARIAFYKAVQFYNPNGSASFSTYLFMAVRNSVHRWLKVDNSCVVITSQDRKKVLEMYGEQAEYTLDRPVNIQPELYEVLSGTTDGGLDEWWDEQSRLAIVEFLHRSPLSPKEREALILALGLDSRYSSSRTSAEVGRTMNVTRQRVDQLVHRAVHTLRQIYSTPQHLLDAIHYQEEVSTHEPGVVESGHPKR